MRDFTMRYLIAVACLLAAPVASGAPVYAGEYGVESTFSFELWSSDGLSLDGTQADAGTDATYRCGTAAEAATTNDYTDEGTTYSIVLSSTEMTCSGIITISINETVDGLFYVQTYGDASANIPAIVQTGDAYALAVTIEGQTDDIGAAGAGLTSVGIGATGLAAIRDITIEDQGGGVSLACALSVVLAYAAGDLATTGADSTYEDPSGTETRATGTVASAGNRTATITCPSF